MSTIAAPRPQTSTLISHAQPRQASGIGVTLWMALAGFAFRMAAMFAFRTYAFNPLPATHLSGPHFTFGWETGSIAGSIASGHGFSSPFGVPTGPTAWIGPIYPYLCAAFFKIFGLYSTGSAIAILTTNCVFAALTCIPLFALTERVFGRRTALWTGWVWALCPLFFRWPITWVWEVAFSGLLTTILLWMAVLAGNRAQKPRWSLRQAGWLGAVSGFSILANPALLIVAGVCALWIAWQHWDGFRPLVKPLAVFALACAATISPWMIRNWAVFGQPVFIRGNFWVEFALGNYHLSNGMGWGGKHPTANLSELTTYKQMGEVAYVASKRAEGLEFLRQYPGEFAALTLKRMAVFWDGRAFSYQPRDTATNLEVELFLPFSILAGLGLWLAIRRGNRAGILFLATALLYPGAYYVTYSQPRYRQAIEPMMLAAIVYLLREGYVVVRRRVS